MAFPSKYEGKCKSCSKPHKVGDMIEKNSAGNYCIDGTGCSAALPPQASSPRVEVPIEQIVAEIQAILSTMVMQDTETKETSLNLSEASIEGIWKYAISRKMSR